MTFHCFVFSHSILNSQQLQIFVASPNKHKDQCVCVCALISCVGFVYVTRLFASRSAQGLAAVSLVLSHQRCNGAILCHKDGPFFFFSLVYITLITQVDRVFAEKSRDVVFNGSRWSE